MGKGLEEIFTEEGAEPQVEEATVEEPKTEEVAEASEAASDGVSQETVEEAPAEEPEETKTVPQQALHEERKKRQEVERNFQDLANQVGQLLPHLGRLGQPEPKQEQEPLPSFSEDPEGFVTRQVEQIRSSVDVNLASAFMTLSENQAKARHDDYGEMLVEFEKLTKANPLLKQQVRQQPDPAEWAYQVAKRSRMISEIGDPSDYETKLREKIKAELAGEEPESPDLPTTRKSLATARNVGGGKRTAAKTFEGPTSLDKALAGRPGAAKS